MKDKKTLRGFDITEFTDDYGIKCSLQKSSSAMEDKIWFGVNDPEPQILYSDAVRIGLIDAPLEAKGWIPYEIPKEVLLSTRMHLTRKQVAELLPYLQKFVETGELR